MPTVPDDAVEAAAEALRGILEPYGDGGLPMDVYRSHARAVLEAAAPVLAGHASRAVLAHMEQQAERMPASMAGRWRRHFGIAARVAAGAFTTRDDRLREAAEHLDKLAAVQRAREEISVLILAQKELCREPGHAVFPKPSCWTCGRNGAFQRAAMIAAGLRDDLEAKDSENEKKGKGNG